ncbi:uncharacterized protein LOC126750169 [Anthonomus grandis grandis]|uniref:uncharacterized protein LOC126750169 n=1 Tax=Anthonomus grandis grandis TaxID=2921223 RepID=UPI00216594B8|nr:uncharacterized protein LOC126750169 [Anthonomus grandis grandis]
MAKDKTKPKKHHQHHKSKERKNKDDEFRKDPTPKASKTKHEKEKKNKKEKQSECHTSKNLPKPPYPFSSSCRCSHHLPRSFPYKEFPPPAPPEGGRDLWDLQFCRWWGWNWVRKRESMMVAQKTKTYEEKTAAIEPKKSCLAKCRGTTEDEFIRADMKLKKASFISDPQIQSAPALSAKEQFKDMCKCLFGKKSAPPAVAKMYKTPSASKVYLKNEENSDLDSDSLDEKISVKETVSRHTKEKSSKGKGSGKSKENKREKHPHSNEERVKTWRKDNFETESTPSYSEACSYKNVPCSQQTQPSQPHNQSQQIKKSSKSSKKEIKECKESSTEDSMEYLTFRLHHIRDNCPCNSEQPEKLQIFMAEAPSCCLGLEKEILPQVTTPYAPTTEVTQVVASTSAHIPEKLSSTSSKAISPEPNVQEGYCQSTCLGLMDHEVWAETEETIKVCQETQTPDILEGEKCCGTPATQVHQDRLQNLHNVSYNSSSYTEKLIKVKSKRQKTICIMVCCCGSCNQAATKNLALPKLNDEETSKKCKFPPQEGCIKKEDRCSCVPCPKQCWLNNKKDTKSDQSSLSGKVRNQTIDTSITTNYTQDSRIPKKDDPNILNDSLQITDDISALFASTALSNKKLSKFGTPSKKYPWMDSLTSAGTTTSLDNMGYHNSLLNDILERDSIPFRIGPEKRSTEDRVILEAMCDAILQEQVDNMYTYLDKDFSSYKELGVDCNMKTCTRDAFSGSSNFTVDKPIELNNFDNTISTFMDTIFSESGHVTPTCKDSKEMTCTTYDRYEYVPKPVQFTKTGLLPQEVKRAPKRPLELKENESKKKLKQEELMTDAKKESERMNNILNQIELIVNKSKEKSAEIKKLLSYVPQPTDLDLNEDTKKRCYSMSSDNFKGAICQPLLTPKVSEESEEVSRITTLNQGNMNLNSSESNATVSKKISKLSVQNFMVCDEKPRMGANLQLLGTSGAKGGKKIVNRSLSLIPVLKSSGTRTNE